MYLSILCLLTLFSPVSSRSLRDAEKGCTGPLLLPNQPFMVVWNVPSGGCERAGFNLNLSAYRIVENTNDSWYGKNMNILYDSGPWPHYVGKQHVPVFGGLPQKGDLKDHLQKLTDIIKRLIPDPNFSGLAAFDFESWRPHLPLNYGSLGVYYYYSYHLVLDEHPTWTKPQIDAEATRQFDKAARAYMQSTLQLARQLRPYGYWGYYGYPRCWGPQNGNLCGKGTIPMNDKYLYWVFTSSTALFPRMYTVSWNPDHERYLFIRETVNETLRIQAKWSGLNVPVMPYIIAQNNGTYFFDDKDFHFAIQEPADMGASGVVIWGSSGLFHVHDECLREVAFIRDTLGPYVKNITDVFEECARNLCHNHGRCVSKEYEAQTQEFLRLNQKTSCVRPREEYENITSRRHAQFGENLYGTVRKYDNYICRCLAGWYGEYCDQKV